MVRLIPLEQAKTKQQSEVDVNQAQSVRAHTVPRRTVIRQIN